VILWRLAHKDYIKLDGIGAKIRGGRWNSPGRPVIYTSSHLSLAVLELMVHLEVDAEDIPDDYVSIEIDTPDDIYIKKMRKIIDIHDTDTTQAYGDEWIKSAKIQGLEVKSVVISQEMNILLNPNHANMNAVKIKKVKPFAFDPRLFQQ